MPRLFLVYLPFLGLPTRGTALYTCLKLLCQFLPSKLHNILFWNSNVHLTANRIKARSVLRFQDRVTVHVVVNGLEIDCVYHISQEIHDLCYRLATLVLSINWESGSHTGLACHRPPPGSKNARCPPRDVVRQTVYGLALNSSNGIA